MSSDWVKQSLKEIAKVKGGKRLPAGSEFAGFRTKYPYLRVKDMVNATIDDTNLAYITDEIEKVIVHYKISKEDLYVTIAGTLGNFGTIPIHLDNAQLTENAAKITGFDRNKFDKDFLKYYFNSNYVQCQIEKEKGIGGGVPKLALHRIEKLVVEYPPKPKQTKIARILTTIDKVIEKTEAAISKYEAIKQGMMQDLFTRGIGVDGQLRPKYEDAPDLYKKSDLGWIPKEWDVEYLDDISSKLTDGSHHSPKPQESGYIIGNVKDMGEFGFTYDTCTLISREEFEHLKKQNCSPIKGDVLLSKDGTIGRLILFDGEKEIVVLSSIAIIRPINEKILSPYLYCILKSHYFDQQLYQLQSGSALKRIVLVDIKKLKIPKPTGKAEQKVIAGRIQNMENMIRLEKNTLTKQIQVKQGLMQDLLTGTVPIKADLVNV